MSLIQYLSIIPERLGMGKFQHGITWAAGLCFAADSMQILLLSFLSQVLQAEWKLSDTEASAITSSVFVGALLGSCTLGPLGDVVGRRPVFCLAAIVISVFGFATACAKSYPILLLLLFLVGFGVGGSTIPFGTTLFSGDTCLLLLVGENILSHKLACLLFSRYAE